MAIVTTERGRYFVHSDITTTFNEYTQTIPHSVRKLVNAVTNDLMASEPEPKDSVKPQMFLNTSEVAAVPKTFSFPFRIQRC
jgi:hypothetical protein